MFFFDEPRSTLYDPGEHASQLEEEEAPAKQGRVYSKRKYDRKSGFQSNDTRYGTWTKPVEGDLQHWSTRRQGNTSKPKILAQKIFLSQI